MKYAAHLRFALLFALVFGLGAVQKHRVDRLRESEAFYRWIVAAATNERLFKDESGDYEDKQLFIDVNHKAEALLPESLPEAAPVITPNPAIPEEKSRLINAAADNDQNRQVWNIARADDLAPERQEFLHFARNGKLQFAKDIQYAEAQEGGVNIFNLFFGFRKVAANFVWLQVDRYWHQGMMHRMIPLMKTCVTLDPNFIDAYLLGAWHLAYNATASMEDTPMPLREWHPKYKRCLGPKETYYYLGIDFLKSGIRNNPRNYKLYFDLGFGIYFEKLHEYANAVKYLAESVRQPHERWVPRQLYRAMEKNGQYEEAKAGWESYLKMFPDNESAPRFIPRNTALALDKKTDEARDRAMNSKDPREIAEQHELENKYKQQALAIWNQMNEPFSEARKLRIQALDMEEQGRYIEAIAILSKARWESNEFFEEASDRIIALKQKANEPLSLSEKKAVLRKESGDTCPGMPPGEKPTA